MTREKLTFRIAEVLAEESGRDQEILLYSLTLVKSSLMGYGSLFLVSYVLGVWKYALIGAITASCFRIFSGGAHATAPLRCSIIGIVIFTGVGFAASIFSGGIGRTGILCLIPLLAATAFYIIFRYAPADTPGKPIESRAQKKSLRTISLLLLGTWTFVMMICALRVSSPGIINYLGASMLGLSWQVFSLTPQGYSTSHWFDHLLKSITERRRKD